MTVCVLTTINAGSSKPTWWSRLPNPLDWNALTALVFLFAFVSLSPFIRIKILPYCDWALAIALVIALSGSAVRIQLRPILPVLLFPTLLAIAVLLSSLTGPEPIRGIDYALKIGFMWLVLVPFLCDRPACRLIVLRVSCMLLVANAAMLVLGVAGFHGFAWIAAIERWETLLCPPGPLSNFAVANLIYSVGLVLRPGRRLFGSLLLASCTVIFVLGASRTSLLVAFAELSCAASISLLYLRFSLKSSIGKQFKAGLVVAGILFIVVSGVVLVLPDVVPGELKVPARLLKLIPSADTSASEYVSQQGKDRIEMYQMAIAKILRSPLWGTGPATTTLGTTPVHNGYLQAWCDLGLLGFIGYAGLYFQFALYFRRACRNLSTADPDHRLWLLQSICYTACGPLIWLFNTSSVELSDLTLTLVHFAAFYSLADLCAPKRRGESHRCLA